MHLKCFFELCIKVVLFTSFFKTFESSVDLPTVTVRGFLNFKTTVDGTVIVFTPISETHPSTVAPKPVTTSSALFPASVEAVEGLAHKNDFIKEKRIQDLSPHNNFLSPHSSSGEEESENAVLLSHQGDKTKKATAVASVSKEDFRSIHSPDATRTVSPKEEKTIAPGASKQVTSNANSDSVLEHVSPTMVESLRPSGIDDALKSTELVSFESEIYDRLLTSEQISLTANGKLVRETVSSKVESPLPSSTSLAVEISSPVTLAITFPERRMSQFETSSSALVEASSEIVSPSLRVEDSSEIVRPSIRVEDSSEIVSPSILVEDSSKILSPSVLVEDSSEIVSPSHSLQRDSVEHSKTLQSSFEPPTFSNRQTPTESLMTEYDEDSANPKKNSSRTRFMSLRRPSQSVRLNRFKVKLTLRHDSLEENDDVSSVVEDEDLLVTESNPTDPAKVVFKETTITSQVTLHVGRRKSIRLLTITTSVPMTVHPTDISHILNTDVKEEESNHNVETRTFTTTERVLKTSIVPVYDGRSTAYHKVTESFFIMKFITAYKTLPTGEITVLDEVTMTPLEDATAPPVTQLSPLQNEFLPFGHALSNNPLAAVYLGLQQLNAQMTLYSTLTDTSTYVKTETFYNTKTVRLYDGKSNRIRTVSEPTSTNIQTITTTITSVRPYINTQAIQQQQRLHQLMAVTQLEPQFETKTSIYTTKTLSTSLSTRIYTLIYNGFSTKFRTITSTTTYPTIITVTSTTKVPLTPTQFYSS